MSERIVYFRGSNNAQRVREIPAFVATESDRAILGTNFSHALERRKIF